MWQRGTETINGSLIFWAIAISHCWGWAQSGHEIMITYFIIAIIAALIFG